MKKSNIITFFALILSIMACLAFDGIQANHKLNKRVKKIETRRTPLKKTEDNFIFIQGIPYRLVVDNYDNWYISEPIDSNHTVFIPSPDFEIDDTQN